MRIFYGKEEGDKRRIKIIDEINILRQSIKNIINELNFQISKIYSDIINSDDFKNIINDINTKYELMNEQKEKIFSQLNIFNKYDIDFNIYFEDIILLNELEIEGNEIKKNSYKRNIFDYLNEQSDYFLRENEKNEINKTIYNYFNILETFIDENRLYKTIEESKNFINIVNEINDKYLTEEFGNRVFKYYTNKDFLNSIFNKYYNDLNEVYLKFNTSFFDINYYNNHRLLYYSKPIELINKLSIIYDTFNIDNSNLQKDVQDLIKCKIKLGISSKSVYEIIIKEYNTFIQMLSNKDCFKNEYNYEIFEKIKNNLKEFIDIYIDGNGNFISFINYTSLNKDDEFNLIDIIVQKGNNIKNNLENIINQIENDFINKNENDTIKLYNFQVSILRSSLKFIQSIILFLNQ